MRTRISHYQLVAELAYDLAKKQLPLYRHKNSPHRYQWPQVVACVLLALYLDLSYRDMEDWLWTSDKICAVLNIKDIPDHSTLCRAFQKIGIEVLRSMQKSLLSRYELHEIAIGIDSTGFRTDQASAYYSFRNGRPKKDWVKGAFVIGTHSQMILGTCASYGRYQDSVLLKSLRNQAKPYSTRHRFVLADAGFDGRQIETGDIIPPVRRHGKLVDPDRIERANLVAQARLDGLNGQRSKCETINSGIKRKFGDTVRSRTTPYHFREIFVKGLIYNINVC
jgi:IS5 family transposase